MPEDTIELVKKMNASVESIQATQANIEKELEKTKSENSDEVKAAVTKANELAEKVTGLASTVLDIEQNMAAAVNKGHAPIETLGAMVVKSEKFKDFAQGNLEKFTFQANTISGQEGSPPVNSDTLVPADRMNGIIPGSFRTLRVSDVLPQFNTDSNSVEYTRELLATNNAAETAEGAQMPESDITFELESVPVRTIGTFLKTSTQVIDDAPALESYINVRLRHFVDFRVDSQIINGDGAGQNLSGMLLAGNHTDFTPQSGENALDSLNRSIEAAALADYPATAIIMNPADWYAISRIKVGADDDRYVFGTPQSIMNPAIWGLPVVVTNAMAANQFITAAFDIAYGLHNRAETTVEMYMQDEDNVQKNLLTIAAKNRKALSSFRPASSQSGPLTL